MGTGENVWGKWIHQCWACTVTRICCAWELLRIHRDDYRTERQRFQAKVPKLPLSEMQDALGFVPPEQFMLKSCSCRLKRWGNGHEGPSIPGVVISWDDTRGRLWLGPRVTGGLTDSAKPSPCHRARVRSYCVQSILCMHLAIPRWDLTLGPKHLKGQIPIALPF